MIQERGKKKKRKGISSWRLLFRSYRKRQSRTPKLKGITRMAVAATKRCTQKVQNVQGFLGGAKEER